jgi:putative addiction module component (TIGR02574 family)
MQPRGIGVNSSQVRYTHVSLKGLIMTITLNEILPLTRDLELSDRAKLAEQLLTSLDEPSEGEVEKLWVEEAKRRLTAYRAGQVEAIPAEEVFRRALADLE